MIRRLAAFLALAFFPLLLSPPASAADPVSPVGTWRVTGYSAVEIGTSEVTYPYGKKPIGYIQYSPGGHVVVFIESGDPDKPTGDSYTDAERLKFFKYIFGAYAGTYTVDGNKVTHHIVAAWRPEWVDHDEVRYAEIDGTKLTIKTAPIVSGRTGNYVVATLTFERVE